MEIFSRADDEDRAGVADKCGNSLSLSLFLFLSL
jgi:hypothetical protein